MTETTDGTRMVEQGNAGESRAEGSVALELALSHPRVRVGEPCTIWVMAKLISKERQRTAGGEDGSTGAGDRLPVGEDFNEDLLIAMAEASGGNFYFIENPDSIPGVFARELRGLLSILAQSIRVTVQSGAGSQVVGFIGYEPVPVPGGVAVQLPDIYEHETKTLLAEIRLPALSAGEHEVCRLTCEYMAVEGRLAKVTTDTSVRIRVGEAGEFTPNLEVLKQVCLFQAAVAKDEAVTAADRGDLSASRKILKEQMEKLRDLSQSAPHDDLLAGEIKNLSGILVELESRRALDSLSRKHLRTSSYTTRYGRGGEA